ncbi:MAG: ABC transporter substrate-binding protein, partial [Anaerolineae bacterium]
MIDSRTTALLATIAGLLLGACSAATPTGETGQAGEPTAGPTPGPDTLVWAIEAAPSTLDPARMGIDPSGVQVAAQVYDRLMSYRPGSPDLAPGIASDWDVDPEGRTFTFTLREGLTFHDGTPLDAAAVAWNFQRWMDPDHSNHQGDFKSWVAYFGGFSGQHDKDGRPVNLVKRVEALDATTVRISLNEPFTPFLHHVAMVPFSIASPTAVRAQGEDYGTSGANPPVGSGPFRVVGWDPSGAVRLEPFADHWSGPPAVSGLHFVPIPDPEKRAEAVAEGAVHGADLPPTTPITGTLAAPTLRVVPRPARTNSWLMVNHSRAPMQDVRVRRAISLAIDRKALAERFGEAALPAGQLLPPDFLGYDPSIDSPERDLPAAKRLMAEADVEDGFELNIWVPTTPRPYLPDPAGTAQAIADMLADISIDASVHSEGLRKFLADRDSGRFTAWITGWEAQSGDPDTFWFWHFGAGRAGAEGQYYNEELAASLLEAQRTMGADGRSSIYESAAQTTVADEARAYLVYTRPIVAVSSRARGYEPGMFGFDDLDIVSLVPAPAGATAAPIPTGAPTSAATPTPLGTPGDEGDEAEQSEQSEQ